MKIRKKLNLFVILTSALASLVAVSLTFWIGSNFLAEKTHQVFQIQTHYTLMELDRLFYERSTDVVVLSRTLSRLTLAKKYDELETILFTLRDYTKSYQNIAYVDENFVKQVDTNRIGIGQKINLEILKKAARDNKVIFDFTEDVDTGTNVISFVKRIYSADGKPSGYIICNVPFSAVSRITRISKEKSYSTKLKKRIELVRSNGDIIFSTYRSDKSDPELAHKLLKNLEAGQDFAFLKTDSKLWYFGRGKNFYTLDSLNWYLVMSAREMEVYEPLRKMILILIIFLILGGYIFWFFITRISKVIVRPLEGASRAVEKFGQGDLSALQSIETPEDDLGVLLQSLKKMGNQIQELITQRAQKARMAVLGEIAGNIAHEINNPLQVISIRLELIQKGLQQNLPSEKISQNIEIASQTVFRISKIVKGLKALSREGDADPFLPVTLQEIIENVLVLCQGTLRSSMVEILADCDQPKFKLECRAVQITQVLLNLVNNAHDAIKDQSEKWIQLKAEVTEGEVQFKVRNSGPKISSSMVQKIFDPFYTTKKAGEGTGLGLSISRKIAQVHSGSLYVDPGDVHTCFILRIASTAKEQKESLNANEPLV